MIYPDTSFLVPIYIEEKQSAGVDRYLKKMARPLCFTPFQRLKLRTALRGRVFQKDFGQLELRTASRNNEEDLMNGTLQHTSLVWGEVLREAERLGEAHLTEIGARPGDLLHVASAVVLGARELLTFDERQAELARRAGLKVKS